VTLADLSGRSPGDPAVDDDIDGKLLRRTLRDALRSGTARCAAEPTS